MTAVLPRLELAEAPRAHSPARMPGAAPVLFADPGTLDPYGAMALGCPICGRAQLRITAVSSASDPATGPRAGHVLWPRTGREYTSDEATRRADRQTGAVVFLDYQCASGCRGALELQLGTPATVRLVAEYTPGD